MLFKVNIYLIIHSNECIILVGATTIYILQNKLEKFILILLFNF